MNPADKRLVSSASALALACVLISVSAMATPTSPRPGRIEVNDLRPLLIHSITHGSAYGRLVGPGADYIRRRFGTAEPIEVDVLRLGQETTSGCARLRVITRQKGTALQGTRKEEGQMRVPEHELVYRISFCTNGKPMETQGRS